MNILKFFRQPKFEEFAEEWLLKEYAIKAPASLLDKQSLLRRVVFPKIGQKRLNKITYHDITDIVVLYRQNAPRSVKKLIQILNRIFIYATDICGYKLKNPVKAGVKLLYPNTPSSEFSVINPEQYPTFFKKVNQIETPKEQTKIAFWLIAYTALRRSEVMRADWQEIDLQEKIWTIPTHRIKTRHHNHLVPLSNQVINLLICLQKTTGRNSGCLFDIDPSAPLRLCKLAGFQHEMTLHGLRKIFSTTAHESGLWRTDAIELQLSHRIKGVRGIYNKAQYLNERRQLMQWYADKLDTWR